MKQNSRILLKVSLISISVIIVLCLVFQLAGSYYVKPKIAEQLEKLVRNGSDSLYRIDYSKISINLWAGSIKIKDVKIFTDSTQFYALKNRNELPSVTIKLNVAESRIGGFGVLKFLFSKEISANNITTKDADVTLFRHFQNNKPKKVTNSVPLWKLIRPDVKNIYVGEIIFDNLRMSYFNRDSSTAFQWKFEQFDTKISDVLIDSISSMDGERLLYAGNIETQIHGISLYSADSLYEMGVGKISYSLRNRLASVDSFHYGPALSKKAFYEKTKMEKDIYTLDFPSLKLINFRPELFLSDNTFSVDSLILQNANIDIYHDRIPADDTTSKLGKYPHQLLLKAPFFVRVGKAIGGNISVTYTEKDSKTQKEGSLYFKNIMGEASHISNHPDDIAQDSILEVSVGGVFMKTTQIRGKFKFDLTKTDGTFEAEANIGPTDVTVLNPVVEALASSHFKSLKTGNTYYKIRGNELEAYGYLKMPYSDLHLQVLNIPEQGKAAKNKTLQTWAVKTFSHNENPGKDGQLRIAENVREVRNKNRSFFNLIWKTLFVAAKDVAMKDGIKKIAQKQQEKKRAEGK